MSKLVLVIDDSITVCKIIEICLRRAGYEVKCFSDGMQAMQSFNERVARVPDLIFIDLILPELDGYRVIQYFRAQPVFSRTIFVILTRRNGTLDKLKGRLVGAHAYLTKPFKTEQILSVVQAYLGVPVPGS